MAAGCVEALLAAAEGPGGGLRAEPLAIIKRGRDGRFLEYTAVRKIVTPTDRPGVYSVAGGAAAGIFWGCDYGF